MGSKRVETAGSPPAVTTKFQEGRCCHVADDLRTVTVNTGGCEPAAATYATSTAWRPLYQPHVGHTVWGSLTAVHRGHVLRDGARSFQLLARPLRTFILDFFFLGTAMIVSFPVVLASGSAAHPELPNVGCHLRERTNTRPR